MSKVLYALAVFCVVIGLYDASGAIPGSHRELEAGILLIAAPILALFGFAVGRATSKRCPACAERVKKAANICKHCGSSL